VTGGHVVRDEDWRIVARWREYEGEQRANVLRVVGVAAFYALELVNRYGLHLGPVQLAPVPGVDARFHGAITALAVAWIALAGGIVVALRSRLFPPWLKYVTAATDTLLLTAMLSIADGPASPLVVVYFPLIALSALREDARLVRFATLGALLGYGSLVAGAAWLRPATRVPPYHAALAVLALGLTGVVLARVVQAGAESAREYAARRATTMPAAPGGPAADVGDHAPVDATEPRA
jgi:hypothetical protein